MACNPLAVWRKSKILVPDYYKNCPKSGFGENLQGIVLDSDGDKGARGLSTLAPWSRAVYKPINK
jgi:hypothetical protein